MTTHKPLLPILIFTRDNLAIESSWNESDYHVLAVSTMDAALNTIGEQSPRLIIVDSVLICQQIRAATTIPLLVLCDFTEVDAAFDAGATNCLVQPVHPRLLKQQVAHLLWDTLTQADIERNIALKAEQEQRMLAEALRDTAAAFSSTVNVEEILDIVMENSSHIVPHINSANIMMLEDGMTKIVRHYGYEEAGYTTEMLDTIHFDVDTVPNLRWVKDQQRALVISDTHNSEFNWADSQTSNFVHSIVTAPIVVDGEVLGFINLDSDKTGTFSNEHGKNLQAFANQAAIGLKNARLFEKIQHDAAELEKNVQQRTIALSQANKALRTQIIQRQEAEDKLREERALLRTVIDHIPDNIFVKDRQGRTLLVNQAGLASVGSTSIHDVLYKTNLELYPDSEAWRQYFEREMALMDNDEMLINREDLHINYKGEKRWILVTKVPIHNSQGEVVGLVGVNRDITELKQAQAQLAEERNLLRSLLDTIPDAIYVKDTTHRFVLANPAALKSMRVASFAALLGKTDMDFFSPEQAQISMQQEKAILEKGASIINESDKYVDADGKAGHLLITKLPLRDADGNITGIIGVNHNITHLRKAEELWIANQVLEAEIAERKRAEEAERQQRILAEALRDSVAAINQTLDLNAVLDNLLQVLSDVVPNDAASIMLLEGVNRVRLVRQKGHPTLENMVFDITNWSNLQYIMQTGKFFTTENAQPSSGWHQTPASIWIQSNISVPIMLEDKIEGFLNLDSRHAYRFTEQHAQWLSAFAQQAGTAIRNSRLADKARDYATTLELQVLERTRALENERAQLHAILNAMRDGVIYQVGGMANTPKYVNHALAEMTGFTSEAWLDGSAIREVNTQSWEERRELFQRVEQVLSYRDHWEGEATLKCRDGRIFDAGLVRSEVRDSNGERLGIVTVVRDISQEKALAEQKARFIASASHELRTPIANIKTRLFLMKRRPERFMEHIEIAESVTNLMQNLVEDMFDLSRFERGIVNIKPEPMVLQELIQEIVAYQEPEAERKQIAFVLNMPDEAVQLVADPFRMAQVLINLVKNALNYTPTEGVIHVSLVIEAHEAVIAVADNGPGIAADALPHLFEAFFRLSEDNKGAGLGLSIAQEIVRAHGGSIAVESTVGVGSCFTVRLPLQPHPQVEV
jgi:PAS domain S-box-containing protein